ncbi:MAG: GCN5-related N-acetyltransferase [Thermodesulfobacterium commune]|jgi:amino-acid N-acetyltransferase|uniref:N-acetyltransferase n=1 Tax=Thermodesulfobacterium commune TaxID=1741 RepID=UPI0007487CF0|nr:MAG: GCN5-related N-acetyltransferase [Thermodesulfobacterium commune]
MIRKAKLSDVKYIYKLILHFSKTGEVISRPLSELYEHVRDFFVYQDKDLVVAACALQICWEDLAEIRSLVVSEEYQNKGIGLALVKACLQEAKELEIPRVFVLTRVPVFFEKVGFVRTNKSELPYKVWSDCVRCPKFPDCDEVPMIKEIF